MRRISRHRLSTPFQFTNRGTTATCRRPSYTFRRPATWRHGYMDIRTITLAVVATDIIGTTGVIHIGATATGAMTGVTETTMTAVVTVGK